MKTQAPPESLPVSHYFRDDIRQLEQEKLFADAIQYIGAKSMLHHDGDYRVIERLDNGKFMIRDKSKVRLLANVCAHRQAQMLCGQANTRKIVCPLHGWTYAHNGECNGTPFHKHCSHKFDLEKFDIEDFHGLLFTGAEHFKNLTHDFRFFKHMHLDRMQYSRTVSEKLPYDWKHYMDGFAEDYHVPFVHPGFNNFIDLTSIQWVKSDDYCGQLFKCRSRKYLETVNTTSAYKLWIKLLLEQLPDQLPEFGGVLLHLYPHIMIESYPFFLVVSTIHPQEGTEACVNHIDFFHDSEILAHHPDLVAAAEQAYMETADEDSEMCSRLAEGRKSLYAQGKNQHGPYQTPYEDGLIEFHRYYRRKMGV